MNQKTWQKWLMGLFRITVFILACYFIYQIVDKNIAHLISIEITNWPYLITVLCLSIAVYCLLMMDLVFAWLVLLRFKDPQRCAKIYFKSHIMKYLPGNIFHFMYRHQRTKNKYFTHKELGVTAVHESLILLIAAFIISHLLFLWSNEITWLTDWLPVPFWLIFLMEFVGVVLVAKLLINVGFLTSLFNYFVYFAGMGLITFLLISALDFESQPYLFITACFTASWLVGYVIPGAPGGTGVRELLFILLCSPRMAEHEALIIIALIRLISLFTESMIYFTAGILSRPYGHLSVYSGKSMP